MSEDGRGEQGRGRSFRWSDMLRWWALSALIGVAVVALTAIGRPDWFVPRILAAGGVIGIAVNLCCDLLGRVVRVWTDRLTGARRWAVLVLIFFVGGCSGWLVAGLVTPSLLGVRLLSRGSGLLLPLVMVGGIGVVVGVVLTVYEVLRARLEASFAELRRQEVASKELEIAAEIQRRLLPPQEIEGDGYRIAARHRPARWVAGDFYDVFSSQGGLVLAVADVVGKGVGASLIMASTKAMLPLLASERGAAAALGELNRRLAAELAARQFVAMALVRFDPASGGYELANAGLPDPYLLADGQEPRALATQGPRLPLGVRDDLEYTPLKGRLAPGERLLLFTDGLPEATRPDGSPLGYEGFERLLPTGTASPGQTLDGLLEQAHGVEALEPSDDWTLLLLERTADTG